MNLPHREFAGSIIIIFPFLANTLYASLRNFSISGIWCIVSTIKIPPHLYFYQPQGCKKCNHTGYSSQLGIYEVLSMTPELGQLILKTLSERDIAQEAKKQGRISMRQDGILKVLSGETTLEEVVRVTK